MVLLAVLLLIMSRLTDAPDSGWELTFVDITLGLYLGWITLATLANLSAWLWSLGYRGEPLGESGYGIAMVVIALLIGMATVFAFGRLTPALASSWGLIWVCVARWAGHRTLALAALAAAVVPVVGAIWWKLRDPRPA